MHTFLSLLQKNQWLTIPNINFQFVVVVLTNDFSESVTFNSSNSGLLDGQYSVRAEKRNYAVATFGSAVQILASFQDALKAFFFLFVFKQEEKNLF